MYKPEINILNLKIKHREIEGKLRVHSKGDRLPGKHCWLVIQIFPPPFPSLYIFPLRAMEEGMFKLSKIKVTFLFLLISIWIASFEDHRLPVSRYFLFGWTSWPWLQGQLMQCSRPTAYEWKKFKMFQTIISFIN